MGYSVDMDIVSCVIPASNVQGALKALNAMHEPKVLEANAGGGSSTQRHYSWVGNPPETGWPDLKAALDEWRYEGDYNDEGDFVVHYFSGEKLGDDDQLWMVLAPFAPGMEIECRGECGAIWRWIERDGKYVEEPGHITYGKY